MTKPPLEQVISEVRVAPTDFSGCVTCGHFRHETATNYHPARNRAGRHFRAHGMPQQRFAARCEGTVLGTVWFQNVWDFPAKPHARRALQRLLARLGAETAARAEVQLLGDGVDRINFNVWRDTARGCTTVYLTHVGWGEPGTEFRGTLRMGTHLHDCRVQAGATRVFTFPHEG